MQFVVRHGWTLDATFLEVSIVNSDPGASRHRKRRTRLLEQHNCTVYNLPRNVTQRWTDSGDGGKRMLNRSTFTKKRYAITKIW